MANPRIERLQNDYSRLQQLAGRSPFIHILGIQGSPPTEYTLQFTCRGIERLNGAQPVYREDHRVRIVLGPQYPLEKPGLQWLTPIYHPNIYNGAVCIGSGWSSGGRYLDDLVIYLMQMVRYDGQGLTFTRDAFNTAAYDWAMQNRHLLPVDKRDMFMQNLADSIRILPSSSGGAGSLNINVLGSGNLDIRVRPKS
jgi:ubiquitin-protein ligase